MKKARIKRLIRTGGISKAKGQKEERKKQTRNRATSDGISDVPCSVTHSHKKILQRNSAP